MRAPFNVLILPFIREPDASPLHCVLLRADGGYWESIAGGGEDDETPLQAARRETAEEIGLTGVFYALDFSSGVPKTAFKAHTAWPESLYVIPQHAFAVEVTSRAVSLSREHHKYQWLPYDDAAARLHWQSNQTALWELSERLRRADLTEITVEQRGLRR